MKKKRDSKRHLDTKKVCHPPSLSAQERAVNLHRLAPDIYEEASCSYLTAKEGGRGGKYVFRPLPLFPNSQNPDVSSFPIFSSEERVGRNKKNTAGDSCDRKGSATATATASATLYLPSPLGLGSGSCRMRSLASPPA